MYLKKQWSKLFIYYLLQVMWTAIRDINQKAPKYWYPNHVCALMQKDFQPGTLQADIGANSDTVEQVETPIGMGHFGNVDADQDGNDVINRVVDRFPYLKREGAETEDNIDKIRKGLALLKDDIPKLIKEGKTANEPRIFTSIPEGQKTNIDLCIENPNLKNDDNNKPFSHPSDDKGKWSSSATHHHVYQQMEDGEIKKAPNIVCKYKKNHFVDTKNNRILSSDESKNLFALSVAAHYRDGPERFNRKVVYFRRVPKEFEALRKVCMVDYINQDVDKGSSTKPHQNCKKRNNPYIKQDRRLFDEAREIWKKNPKAKVQSVLNTLQNPASLLLSARDGPQMTYIKGTVLNPQGSHRSNAADLVMKLVSDIREKHSDFVQSANIDGKTGIPKITCFYKWQIDFIRSNCISKDASMSVWTVDRTFNATKGKLL